MNELTKKVMDIDPIAEAEKIIGKRHEDWNPDCDAMFAMRLAMLTNQSKRAYLTSIGDSHFGIEWKKFLELAESYGFEFGYHEYFMGTGYSDNETVTEEEVIMYHRDKGLILHAESFNGTSVNSAMVYGEVKISNEGLSDQQWDAMNGSSHSWNGDAMSFSVDVREGFLFHMDAISEVFEFSKSWSTTQFLWFLNYMDTKIPGYSYEQINSEKLKASVPEVRKIIFG